jgi:hypothetical protein
MIDPLRYVSTTDASGGPVNVFDPPGPFAAAPPPPPHGAVFVVGRTRQTASAAVDLPAPAVLMFKTTYVPGWRASVDGRPVPTMLLTPGFIGVDVPAGQHSVRFEYRAGWLKSLLLVLGVVVAVGVDWRRWRAPRLGDGR